MKAFPNCFLYRLPDIQSGYFNSSNICDFISFESKKLYLIECKSIHGNTLPFTDISQYDRLLRYANKEDIFPGVLV